MTQVEAQEDLKEIHSRRKTRHYTNDKTSDPFVNNAGELSKLTLFSSIESRWLASPGICCNCVWVVSTDVVAKDSKLASGRGVDGPFIGVVGALGEAAFGDAKHCWVLAMLSGMDDEDVAERGGIGTKLDVCSCWCWARANDAEEDRDRRVVLTGSMFELGDLSAINSSNNQLSCTIQYNWSTLCLNGAKRYINTNSSFCAGMQHSQIHSNTLNQTDHGTL